MLRFHAAGFLKGHRHERHIHVRRKGACLIQFSDRLGKIHQIVKFG